jgi:hypothetical protein
MISMKICLMGGWNTDSGASLHGELIGREWVRHGHKLIVLTFKEYAFHGTQITGEDEDYVDRCYTVRGYNPLEFNPLPFLTSDYEIFVVEDLGMLPKEPLGQIFYRVKKKASVVNIIHDGRLSEDPAFYQFEWDAIVCFDERYKKFLKEVYDLDKIHTISYPCHSLQRGSKEDARKLLDLPLDKKIVFGFGPASEKILDDIDALYNIAEEYPLMLLILNKKKEILKKFNSLVGSGKLEIKTREEAPDINKLYKYLHAADLLLFNKEAPQWVVISSTVYQTLGSTCPIVARNAGFISDLNQEVLKYTNHDELEDCIRSVFNQSKKYKETINAALEFVKINSAEKVAERYIELFNRLKK